MSLAKIVAVIDGGSSSEAALTAALQVGRKFSARVDLLHVQIDAEASVPVMGEGMSGAAVEQVIQSLKAEAEARLQEAQRLYDVHCVKAGLKVVEPHALGAAGEFSVSFHHVVDGEVDRIVRYGRLSDLIVLARPSEETEGGLSATFDAALFDTGRPVLLVPPEPVADIGVTVAVAWDRSREVARAVSAGLPFLAKAKRVIILTAREAGTDAEPSELASHLALHGIEARTWAFTPGAGSLGDALLGEAAEAKADLVIMGGYGHSRLRELVLGGATRGVLDSAVVPVLMMH